ncbi:MAG: lytic transglycosylase domain-containing protein [Leptospirillum sp.]
MRVFDLDPDDRQGRSLFHKGISLSFYSASFLCLMIFPFFLAAGMTAPVWGDPLPDAGKVRMLSRYISLHSTRQLSPELCGEIARHILLESRREGIPPYVAVAIAQEESGFDPRALNRKTEDYGLFQVHFPFWKRYFARQASGSLIPIRREDLFGIAVNVRVGMMILRHDIDLERGDYARGIGRYSGRRGVGKLVYEQKVVANEVSFVSYAMSNAHGGP